MHDHETRELVETVAREIAECDDLVLRNSCLITEQERLYVFQASDIEREIHIAVDDAGHFRARDPDDPARNTEGNLDVVASRRPVAQTAP